MEEGERKKVEREWYKIERCWSGRPGTTNKEDSDTQRYIERGNCELAT